MESSQIAAQLLEVIAGGHPQVPIGCRVVDHLELAEETAFDVGRDVPRPDVLNEERPQPLVPKAHNHSGAPSMSLCTAPWYKTQPERLKSRQLVQRCGAFTLPPARQ